MNGLRVTDLNRISSKRMGTVRVNTVLKHLSSDFKEGTFEHDDMPDTRQIYYQLKKFRNSTVEPLFKLGDLKVWCDMHCSFPSQDDESFVLAHDCSSLNEKMNFRFTLTTPELLRRAKKFKTICIDATYKLNWHGFPLIVFGTVDRLKRFHPIASACTTNETTTDYEFVFQSIRDAVESYFGLEFEPTTMIADGADAICNVFYNVFPSTELDIMCAAHVIRNIRKRPFSTKTNKQLVPGVLFHI